MEIEQHYEPEEPQDEDLEAVLSTVAAEGEGAILVQISKIDKGRAAWIFNAHPVDMPHLMERIRDEYGSGDYEAVIRRGNRIARRKRFSLLVPAKPIREEPKTNNEMQVVLQGMNQLGSAITELGKLIVAAQTHATPPAPQMDQFAMMQQTIGMMGAIKSLFDSNMPRNDPMEGFLKGIEFAKELAIGENGGEEPSAGKILLDMSKQLVPLAAGMMERGASQPAIQSARIPAQMAAMPAPPGVQAVTQSAKEPQNVNIFVKTAIKGQVDKLIQLAQFDADPTICAQKVIEGVPVAYRQNFAEFIMAPDAIEQLVAMNPNVNAFREWFEMLREDILVILTGTGNGDNTGGNQVSGIVEIDSNDSATNGHSIG